MQSEVRKVLATYAYYMDGEIYSKLDAAERADAARREVPVQALRQAVAELVSRWMERAMPLLTAGTVRELLDELNTIIATKPDAVEDQPATASGPVQDVTPADGHIRAIAAQAVRDAMPDAVEDAIKAVAATLEWDGFPLVANAFRTHAAKLRKERGV